jgi:hypothetical protein
VNQSTPPIIKESMKEPTIMVLTDARTMTTAREEKDWLNGFS